MILKIISIYKEIPRLLEIAEKKNIRRNTSFLDMLIDEVKILNPREDRNNLTALVAIVAHYLDFENADSHSTRMSALRVEDYKLEGKIQELYKQCITFAPQDLTVYISLSNPKHKHLRKIKGVSGTTPFKKNIALFIWPHENWHQKVLEVFVHELAHAKRIEKFKGSPTLLEYIVSEGISQSIVLEILGVPNKMRVPSEMKLWNMYKANMNVTNKKKIHKLVFGDKKNIPLMAGYFMGYRIVQNYLQKTGKKASEIINVSAKDILEVSDYSKK